MSKCKQMCGFSLMAAVVIGLVMLLVVYIIVMRVSKSNGKGSNGSKAGATGAAPTSGVPDLSEQEVLQQGGQTGQTPLVVMLYMDGCGHCNMMKPDFVKVAQELGQQAHFAVCNGIRAKKICGDNNIEGFPALLRFQNGQQVDKAVGRQDAGNIKKFALA
jgi:thioredoxin-like negative regulator of GroEL